jgi:hypothetical protein
MKKFNLAVALAAVATMAVASAASASVERYQEGTLTIIAVQPEGAVGQWQNVWTHTYDVLLNPCDGSFAGTGEFSGTINGFYDTETITGQLDGDTVSFTAVYDNHPISYTLSGAPLDSTTVTLATSLPVVDFDLEFTVDATFHAETNYKNHGEYVKKLGGGSDAAHWCIGMPIR